MTFVTHVKRQTLGNESKSLSRSFNHPEKDDRLIIFQV